MQISVLHHYFSAYRHISGFYDTEIHSGTQSAAVELNVVNTGTQLRLRLFDYFLPANRIN